MERWWRVVNTHPFVRVAAWLASLASASGQQDRAESYVGAIVSWYVTNAIGNGASA
jgi:hypothetical protein